jgi:hypothetical protein
MRVAFELVVVIDMFAVLVKKPPIFRALTVSSEP